MSTWCCGLLLALAAAPTPEMLLANVHAQLGQLTPSGQCNVLYELAIAATGLNAKTSADWALEMYDVATHRLPDGQGSEQMNRAANRKNALTVLSFSEPDAAAKRFFELEPSGGHAPFEDPRVDLSRHLFPALWEKHGKGSLRTIRLLAEFTTKSGEYPYVGIGNVLPSIAKVDPGAARGIFNDAVRQLAKHHGSHRTQSAYLQFLRASWSVAGSRERRHAVLAGIAAAQDAAGDIAVAEGAHYYVEYYLEQETVHLGFEESRIYDLLPFVDEVDRKRAESLRQQYPRLRGIRVSNINAAPWKSAVYAAPGRDAPGLVEQAIERAHIMALAAWAQQDARRSAAIALSAKDADLRLAGLAILLPFYVKTDPQQAEGWRRELAVEGKDHLAILAPLVRADFLLGHPDEARALAGRAWRSGKAQFSGADPDYEGYSALQQLTDTCGQFDFGDRAWLADLDRIENREVRLLLTARYARGALRNKLSYKEPQ
jgi:hypothetical protein